MYFTSAGNFANKAWQDVFTPESLPDGTIYPEGTTGWVHSQQLDMNVESDGEYIVVLQWDEPAASHGSPTGALFDLDLTVANESLRPIAGNNKYSVERDPTEIMVIKSEAASSAKLVVTCECETPPTNLAFRVVMFKTTRNDGFEGLTFANPLDAPTITGQAMSDNAVAVGASFYGYYDSGAGPDNEPFSSFGGTLPNLDEVLPNITASDGSNTGVLSIGEDIEFDIDSQFTNFFGTSAAAPHAAAAAALYLSVAPIWHPDGIADKLTDPLYATGNPADEVLGLFTQTAVPTSNPAQGGPGLLKAVEAFKLIASQTPVINDAVGEEGKTISAEEVLVTLIGDYFTPSSQVFFDDEEVPTTYISETEIQGLIPTFSGQGKLTVITNASSTPTGTDNPVSDGFDLLDGRRAINIIANDITLEFGQDYLDDLTYTVEGLEEGETLESLGYPEVLLSPTAVGAYPDVNNYTIFGAFAEPLTPEQQEQSIITFGPGTLSFTHKDLIIQPQDTTAIYGEEPIIVMNYIYDDTGISDNNDFMNTLLSEHRSTYFTEDNGSGLVNRFSAVVNRFSAVVNENPSRINELLNLIENSNWVATRTTIENRFSPVVNGFNLVGFDADQLLDYLDNPLVGNSGSIENRFSAVVNGSDLVSGLTSIYNPLENRFSPVVNRFSAVVNRFSAVVNIPLGDEDDVTDYSELLAIVDAEDGVPEGTDPDELPPTEVYSIDVITGTDVTETEEDRHYILPGAPLSPFFANFNKNLLAGRLAWTPKSITVDLDDGEEAPFEIQYGEAQPSYSSTVDPLGYQDQVTVIYSLDPEATEPVGAGNYSVVQEISMADSEGKDKTFNYEITSIDGSLVVNPGTLTITTEDVVIETGNDLPPASDINSAISGFIDGETVNDVFQPNGPVFSYSSDDYDNAGRVPGTYLLTTAVTPEPVNYILEISEAQVLCKPF